MPTTYIVKIMASLYYKKVAGSWNQFVNVEKHVKDTRTIHLTLQFLPFVSQQYTADAMVGSSSSVSSMTENKTLHTAV